MFRGLFTGGLISDESLTEMTSAGVNPGYGLGVGIDDIGGPAGLQPRLGGTPGIPHPRALHPRIGSDAGRNGQRPCLPTPDMDEFIDALLPILMESWGLAG